MKTKYSSKYEEMTQANVTLLIIKLCIPTTISMLITNIYNLVDTMFVGKLGTSASGAVGIVFGYMAILQAVGFMIGQGTGSIISRCLGGRKENKATEFASSGFFLAFFIGGVISIVSLVFMKPLLYMLGSTDTIYEYAQKYIFNIILVAPFTVSTFVLNNILRYEGKAYLSMVGLVIGAILNIYGDYFLMFRIGLGITGAGLSTGISQFFSFGVLFYMFQSGKTQSRVSIKYISRKIKTYSDIVTTGFPSLLRQGLTSVATMILNQRAGFYGDYAIAAMSISSRITLFFFQIGTGIGQGFQPVCGYNYGAKNYKRLKRAFFSTLAIEEIILSLLAIVGYFEANRLFGYFSTDAAVLEIGEVALKYRCLALVVQPLCLVSSFTLQCTGQRIRASVLSTFRNGVFYIPLLFILSAIMGLFGIQIAQPVADVCAFFAVFPFIIPYMRRLTEQEKKAYLEGKAMGK